MVVTGVEVVNPCHVVVVVVDTVAVVVVVVVAVVVAFVVDRQIDLQHSNVSPPIGRLGQCSICEWITGMVLGLHQT